MGPGPLQCMGGKRRVEIEFLVRVKPCSVLQFFIITFFSFFQLFLFSLFFPFLFLTLLYFSTSHLPLRGGLDALIACGEKKKRSEGLFNL